MDETDEYVDVHKRYWSVRTLIFIQLSPKERKIRMDAISFIFAESVLLQLLLLHQWHGHHQVGG